MGRPLEGRGAAHDAAADEATSPAAECLAASAGSPTECPPVDSTPANCPPANCPPANCPPANCPPAGGTPADRLPGDCVPRHSAIRRRRGSALEDAILAAAYQELCECGLAQFSIEGVAARSRTGKASIYRRWPQRHDLLVDALSAHLPTPQSLGLMPDVDSTASTGQILHAIAAAITAAATGPAGQAIRALKMEAVTDPLLARTVDERFQAPRRAALLGLLRRGVARGEVRPDAVREMIADVLPAMILHRVLMLGEPLLAEELHEMVDNVLLPLIEPR